MSKIMSKEEALEAFKDLLEVQDIEEVIVQKIFIDNNRAFKSKTVIRVLIDRESRNG